MVWTATSTTVSRSISRSANANFGFSEDIAVLVGSARLLGTCKRLTSYFITPKLFSDRFPALLHEFGWYFDEFLSKSLMEQLYAL